MGNLCNCFIPRNVDDDYDFSGLNYDSHLSEKRHLYEKFETKRDTHTTDMYVCATAHGTSTPDTRQVSQYHHNHFHQRHANHHTDNIMDQTNNDTDIFTISCQKLFNLQSTYIDLRDRSGSELDELAHLLNYSSIAPLNSSSIYVAPRATQPQIDFNLKPLAPSPKPTECLLYIDTAAAVASLDSLSLDSGFNSSSSTRCSSPISSNYIVLRQEATVPGRNSAVGGHFSIFNYLFDLSLLLKQSVFNWSQFSWSKLRHMMVKQAYTVNSYIFMAMGGQNRLRKRSVLLKNSRISSSASEQNKPFSLFALLSKLNVFSFFSKSQIADSPSATIRNPITSDAESSYLFYAGFSPLRHFFLRIFDINFF